MFCCPQSLRKRGLGFFYGFDGGLFLNVNYQIGIRQGRLQQTLLGREIDTTQGRLQQTLLGGGILLERDWPLTTLTKLICVDERKLGKSFRCYYSNKSGLRSCVLFKASSWRQFSILAWSPLKRIAGTLWPFQSAGRE